MYIVVLCGEWHHFINLLFYYIYRWSSVYLITLWIIVRRELIKFLLVALLFILAFSVALRFAVHAERDEVSRLQNTLANQSGSQVCISGNGSDANTTTCVNTTSIMHLGGYVVGELQ